ncbi:hypothiocyanous acid reductase MerA [Staphylococcus arlettae]|uniref:hypothiocyanous acid reductase MerA n=1 Tax=Staphylococcus arlettae TaxID=29378 RepID=UPI001CA64709|nr:hypothiocyanous acid reductase MerA [Staphylococcus arlettae]QZZ03265.1 FAD-containing oxidoreductase [Staphylococcus arlettae]
MKTYDLIVIGFGKGGKTLAKFAATQGKKVAMIEQSPRMYGGTCINIGCIPSKTLVHEGLAHSGFKQAMQRKEEVIDALNNKNYHNLADEENITVFDNKAKFQSNDTVALLNDNGSIEETVTAENIVINTGATPVILPIDGIKESQYLYDSTGIMNLPEQPQRLVIVGGGYIALEFASIFANFGTEVTVLEHKSELLAHEDREVVAQVEQDLTDKGVTFVYSAETTAFEDQDDHTLVRTSQGDFAAEAVLLATGRKPNTDLELDNTDIKLGERQEIAVNDKLQTTVPHIYALGDVKGGMQFTYISLDDFRIVRDQLLGNGQRTTNNRGAVPYTMFVDPPFSRVGLTAAEAEEQGYDFAEGQMAVNAMPRHKINHDERGLFKVVIDKSNNQILGATLYGAQTEEIINIIKLAIDQQITYDVLRDNIYTHPTMIESFNDLFNI